MATLILGGFGLSDKCFFISCGTLFSSKVLTLILILGAQRDGGATIPSREFFDNAFMSKPEA